MKMQRERVVSCYWRALENQSDDTDKKLEDWDMNSPTGSLQKKERQWTCNLFTRKQKAELKYTLAANMQIEEKVALLL